jgi:hypothetical protein
VIWLTRNEQERRNFPTPLQTTLFLSFGSANPDIKQNFNGLDNSPSEFCWGAIAVATSNTSQEAASHVRFT